MTPSTFWLITTGEPLPTDQGNPRLLRTGILAETLVAKGAEVVWWTSSFNHANKFKRHVSLHDLSRGERFQIRLLNGISYPKNVSILRQIANKQVAAAFKREAKYAPRPDLIVCALPTLELCRQATRYGEQVGAPVLIDIRDLWPDIFLDVAPDWARRPVRALLNPMYSSARKSLASAYGLIAVSQSYLDWGIAQTQRGLSSRDAVFPLGYRASHPPQSALDRAQSALLAKGINPECRIFCFIGSFGHSYDLETVINAARQLRHDGNKNLQFVFAGEGEYGDRWRAMAEGLDNTKFVGWLDAPGVMSLMQQSVAGLLAYRTTAKQSLPNKLFEYMSAGLPVLSSLAGESTEVIRRSGCGLYYDSGDTQALINSVLRLANDEKLRAEMSARCLTVFRRDYSAEKIYGQMAEFFDEIIQENSARSTGN
jgi:glycosyltransferase involved in cell wall biosynthesis